MEITGIVAEYNPFHNGHLYQIQETKKSLSSDAIIAVMSGNFSQRGEATITHKYNRTQMALSNGVDLVLELPVVAATASAEHFAYGSIRLLWQTGIVTSLSFGSECGKLTQLMPIADALIVEKETINVSIQHYLKKGLSYPKAREQSLIDFFSLPTSASLSGSIDVLKSPNNILGIEYLKALRQFNAAIKPYTIKREGAHYHAPNISGSIASASAIRQTLYNGSETFKEAMPASSAEFLTSHKLPSMEKLGAFLHFKLMFSSLDELYTLWDIPKDLLHTLIKSIKEYPSYEKLVERATSKTYTRSTVQRSLLRILLEVQKDDFISREAFIPYIRVLGCKQKATYLLKALSQNAKVPVITNLNKQYASLNDVQKKWIDYEIKASKLYAYASGDASLATLDFTHPFILI